MTKTPQRYLECDQAQISFGFSAARRKPDQVHCVAKFVVFIRRGFQRCQQEGQLERAPTIGIVGAGLALKSIMLTHLIQHGAIGQGKGQS